MLKVPFRKHKVDKLNYIYLATLLLAFHAYFIAYINSSFLQQFIGESKVGLLYAISGFINIFILLRISHFYEKFGSYVTLLWVCSLEILMLTILASADNALYIVFAFIGHQMMNSIMFLTMDEFLESSSNNSKTGYLRGIFNTVISVTAVVSPVIVGSILVQSNDYSSVYILSSLFLLPLLIIVGKRFKNLKDKEYHKVHIKGGIQALLANKNLKNIYLSNLSLQLFYSWMVIFIPIYLNQVIGFSWQQLGLMISIALLPFMIFEIPVGNIADKKLGEKEILITGAIIISLGLLSMSLYTGASFIIWASILFFSRIGASFIEIASESYFFKQINSNNQNLLSVFRTTVPLGALVGSLIGSLVLIAIGNQYMYIVMAIWMLFSIKFAYSIKDTK